MGKTKFFVNSRGSLVEQLTEDQEPMYFIRESVIIDGIMVKQFASIIDMYCGLENIYQFNRVTNSYR